MLSNQSTYFCLNSQLEDALEEDEQCQRAHLAEKLQEVTGMLEEDGGNDYLLS